MFYNIKAYQIGLVFKNNRLIRVMQEGKHFTGFGESVELFDMSKPFVSAYELDVLLQNEELRALVHVVEVKDDEIALMFRNSNLLQVLLTGRYVYFKEPVNYGFTIMNRQSTERIDPACSIDEQPTICCIVAWFRFGNF
jgi:hypothetical protein